MSEDDGLKAMGQVIQIDEARIKDHLGRIVRGTVEDTLNALLDAEADRLCDAKRYERTEARRDLRAGTYQRKLHTRAGEVSLRVPKLRRQTFETAIIERYRRRESSVEEALIEMYLAGVSVRRVEDITEALWGTRVSPGTVSRLNQKIYTQIEAWRNRPITGTHPYVYLDGVVLKRSWAGEVRNVSLLVAIGVSAEGFREILGICEGAKEDQGLVRLSRPAQAARPRRRRAHSRTPAWAWSRALRHFPGGQVAALRRALVPQHLQPCAPREGARGQLRASKMGKSADLVEQAVPEDQNQQSAEANHERDQAQNPRGRCLAPVPGHR